MKYLLEDHSQALQESCLLDPLAKRAAERGWTWKPGEKPLLVLIDLALKEWFQPESCGFCGGNGARLVSAKVVPCVVCEGSGVFSLPKGWHARCSGLDWAVWEPRYRWLLGLMREWESLALGELSRALRLDDDC
ncbi:MAG: hypothetical protein ACYCOX_18705 [Acidobacteriaceae bacterium]